MQETHDGPAGPGQDAPDAPDAPGAKDRPLRLEYVDPASLDDNPRNWRRHPALQKEALEAALDEVGWAGALLWNEETGRLVDGHARKALALQKGIAAVPVLIGRWSPQREAKILATLDPLAAMAETDPAALNDLLRGVETGSQALATLLTQLAEEAKLIPPSPADDGTTASGGPGDAPGDAPADSGGGQEGTFALKVTCPTEAKRDDLLAALRADGYDCAPL